MKYQVKTVIKEDKDVVYLELASYPGCWFTIDGVEFNDIEDDPEGVNCSFNVFFEDDEKEINAPEFIQEVKELVNEMLTYLEKKLNEERNDGDV